MGQRQDRERSELARAVAGELRAVFVARAGERDGRGILIVEPNAGHRDRQERGRDASGIHISKRFFRGPFQGLRQTEVALFQIGNVGRRREVMVHVNKRGLAWRLCPATRRHKAAQRQAGGAAKDAAPAQRQVCGRRRFLAAGAAAKGPFAARLRCHTLLPVPVLRTIRKGAPPAAQSKEPVAGRKSGTPTPAAPGTTRSGHGCAARRAPPRRATARYFSKAASIGTR